MLNISGEWVRTAAWATSSSACIDGLSGFPQAIRAAYPQNMVQLCIVHLVRAALRYVTTEDSKRVTADLKKLYQAATVPCLPKSR